MGPVGGEFRKATISPTSVSCSMGQGRPSSCISRNIFGPCRQSAVASVMVVTGRPWPRKAGPRLPPSPSLLARITSTFSENGLAGMLRTERLEKLQARQKSYQVRNLLTLESGARDGRHFRGLPHFRRMVPHQCRELYHRERPPMIWTKFRIRWNPSIPQPRQKLWTAGHQRRKSRPKRRHNPGHPSRPDG